MHVRELLTHGITARQQHYRGRFAPSPSGPLHLGNLRTALIGWLDARLKDGEWLLRIDDLDAPRNQGGADQAIQADLQWLELDWDGPIVRQSQRRGLYATVLSGLRRSGHLYPCLCSRRLLADVSAPHGGLSVYPGYCRGRQPHWGGLAGRWPSWRLRLPPGPIVWQERWGPQGLLQGTGEVGDVLLRRADGVIAYHLATAVDEVSLAISDVVRGVDLWSSTGAQVAVMAALGVSPPRFGHVPLLRDRQGRRLSKRQADSGLDEQRSRGKDAAAVVGGLAASLDLVPSRSRLSAQELLEETARDKKRFELLINTAALNHSIQFDQS